MIPTGREGIYHCGSAGLATTTPGKLRPGYSAPGKPRPGYTAPGYTTSWCSWYMLLSAGSQHQHTHTQVASRGQVTLNQFVYNWFGTTTTTWLAADCASKQNSWNETGEKLTATVQCRNKWRSFSTSWSGRKSDGFRRKSDGFGKSRVHSKCEILLRHLSLLQLDPDKISSYTHHLTELSSQPRGGDRKNISVTSTQKWNNLNFDH